QRNQGVVERILAVAVGREIAPEEHHPRDVDERAERLGAQPEREAPPDHRRRPAPVQGLTVPPRAARRLHLDVPDRSAMEPAVTRRPPRGAAHALRARPPGSKAHRPPASGPAPRWYPRLRPPRTPSPAAARSAAGGAAR